MMLSQKEGGGNPPLPHLLKVRLQMEKEKLLHWKKHKSTQNPLRLDEAEVTFETCFLNLLRLSDIKIQSDSNILVFVFYLFSHRLYSSNSVIIQVLRRNYIH